MTLIELDHDILLGKRVLAVTFQNNPGDLIEWRRGIAFEFGTDVEVGEFVADALLSFKTMDGIMKERNRDKDEA